MATRTAGFWWKKVYSHLLDYPAFEKVEADALAMAMAMAMATAESEARRRAIDGVERICRKIDNDGTVHEHVERKNSDTILLRLLERLETGSWRQKQQMIEHSPGPVFATRAERKDALEKARSELAKPCPVRSA